MWRNFIDNISIRNIHENVKKLDCEHIIHNNVDKNYKILVNDKTLDFLDNSKIFPKQEYNDWY
jgi:hypothetical protein